MTFTYFEITNEEAGIDLWQYVTNTLSSYNPSIQATAKITCSDQNGGDSRALIIYSTDFDITTIPDQSSLSDQWQFQEFTTSNDYDEMYGQCVNFLNSDQLTDAQRYYARIGMTNAKGHDSHLVVFFRGTI